MTADTAAVRNVPRLQRRHASEAGGPLVQAHAQVAHAQSALAVRPGLHEEEPAAGVGRAHEALVRVEDVAAAGVRIQEAGLLPLANALVLAV